ncbi:MAG: RecQ family ATP-dependent DNA helicase [Patescibacteria group bacterium]|jgi:ATP-dependent DNA helicase RecQ
MPDNKKKISQALKEHFNYNHFRPGQERAIESALEGKDALIIMPTGGGKSLCYQLPALMLPGITIVISPLIALMKDQVDGLEKRNIPATFINSSITPEESASRISGALAGTVKLLYIAPERFYNADFLRALKDLKVSLFAIDEAHCISEWGHDFRPSYMRLWSAISAVGRPPVMALTATATPEVRDDIARQLKMDNPASIITGFSRPGLQFGAIQANDAMKINIISNTVGSMEEGGGIVYAGTRAKADGILAELLNQGVEAVGYHAGMDSEERKWVQEDFMNGRARVIVATNAFGLGIDKKDIRFVIHHDMPGTIEAYYQEAGRAGRDGKPALCLLLYAPRDRYLREFFIKGDNPPPAMVLDLYEALKSIDANPILVTYATLREMLSHDVPEMAVGTALKILEREGYISRAREKNGNAYLKFLEDSRRFRGLVNSRAKRRIEILEKLFNYFDGRLNERLDLNIDEAASIIEVKKDVLTRALRKSADEGLLEYEPPFKGTEISLLKNVSRDEVKIDFSAMREKLERAYEKLEAMENYIYHFGCRQKYILDYFGEENPGDCKKCDNCLVGGGYARKNSAPKRELKSGKSRGDRRDFRESDGSKSSGREPAVKLETKLTQLTTYDLYKEGKTIEEIAKERELAEETIENHVCFLIDRGMIKEIKEWVGDRAQKKILAAIKTAGPEKMKPIKELLGEEASYREIKFVLSKYKKDHE